MVNRLDIDLEDIFLKNSKNIMNYNSISRKIYFLLILIEDSKILIEYYILNYNK